MRSMKDVGASSYVREGAMQDRFTMYTAAPSSMVQPEVPVSPPPWDGSAEGFGPAATDYGVFYKKHGGGMGCAGCGERGMGAFSLTGRDTMLITFGAVAGLVFAPKLKVKKLTGAAIGASLGYMLYKLNFLASY